MRVALTAGFDRAMHVVLLAELLVRRGHEIACVVVVTPFDVARFRSLVRQRGAGFVLRAAGRVFDRTSGADSHADELIRLAESSQVRTRTLRKFCRTHDVPRTVVNDLNGEVAIRALKAARPDVVAYGGGGILRRAFLQAAGGKVLNAHSGSLPEIRGMNACEWSLLLGLPTVVTIHWIDEGIDTGPTADVAPVEVRAGDTVDVLRSRCAAVGVQAMAGVLDRLAARSDRRDASPRGSTAEPPRNRQCFILAPVLREILDRRLAERKRAAP